MIGDEGYVSATSGAAAAFFDTYGASINSNSQPSFVDQTERQLNAPIVGMAATPNGLGYWLVADARGHGLAAHALRAVVSFAFDALSIPRLHLFVEPWNVASARTAEAAGFTREATLRGWERIDGEQRDADCFALLHSQWARPD